MAAERFSTNKATIQFLYPFKIDRWEDLRDGLCGFLDEQGDELHLALESTLSRLKEQGVPGASHASEAQHIIGRCLDGRGGRYARRETDATLMSAMRSCIGEQPPHGEEAEWAAFDLARHELGDLLRRHDSRRPERVMAFLREALGTSALPLRAEPRFLRGDDRGARGYLERRNPYLELVLRADALALENPETLPDVADKLPPCSHLGGRPGIRLTVLMRLMASGFGCIRLKLHLADVRGFTERVDEIVFSAQGAPGMPVPMVLGKKAALARDLQGLTRADREMVPVIDEVCAKYAEFLDVEDLGRRLSVFLDEVTWVSSGLSVNSLVSVANLDRGHARGQEPRLMWKASGDVRSGDLWEYFRYATEDVILAGLAGRLAHDPRVREFCHRSERRRHGRRSENRARTLLVSSLSQLRLYGQHLAVEEHPYVTTFVSAPAAFKKPKSATTAKAVEHFHAMVDKHREDLYRILMKSNWATIRSDWAPTSEALENVFYSDLIYMAVDIRGALCLYYTPSNAYEYKLLPELSHGCKYREELSDILQTQRMLWYAYAASDHLITEDIKQISSALEVLKEESLAERFPQVIEGLSEVVGGIERRKMALAEVMEDPISRKGGSSLFSGIVDKTTRVFHLNGLYRSLHDKLDRLDMLGVHVSENVQEYSNLLVQEGSRAAQLTLEFLEAFIVGFYFAELTHLMVARSEHGVAPYPLSEWWGFYSVAVGAFLTGLPVITLIRKGRSRVAFENPPWLDYLERMGIVVGPAILLLDWFLGWSAYPLHGGEAEEYAVHLVYPWWRVVFFIVIYAALVGGWYQLSERAGNRLLAWWRRRVGARAARAG